MTAWYHEGSKGEIKHRRCETMLHIHYKGRMQALPHFSTCHPMLRSFLPLCCSGLCFSQLPPQQALCLSSPSQQGPLFF